MASYLCYDKIKMEKYTRHEYNDASFSTHCYGVTCRRILNKHGQVILLTNNITINIIIIIPIS